MHSKSSDVVATAWNNKSYGSRINLEICSYTEKYIFPGKETANNWWVKINIIV